MNSEHLERNCEALKELVPHNTAFGSLAVQRICGCGFGEANETIQFGLESRLIKRDPHHPRRFFIVEDGI